MSFPRLHAELVNKISETLRERDTRFDDVVDAHDATGGNLQLLMRGKYVESVQIMHDISFVESCK